MTMNSNKQTAALPPVYCALDTPDLDKATALARAMADAGCGVKLGLEFFCAQGPAGVAAIRARCPALSLFLDLKLHDIPNTVAGALQALAPLAPDYITLHASGGAEMMKRARDAVRDSAAKFSVPESALLGVSILTSLDNDDLEEIGYALPVEGAVMKLGHLVRAGEIAGMVCSPREVKSLRAALGPDVIFMVPGIRPAGSETQDQKRVMTPAEARAAGATHLVIGRPITEHADPARAAREILENLRASA